MSSNFSYSKFNTLFSSIIVSIRQCCIYYCNLSLDSCHIRYCQLKIYNVQENINETSDMVRIEREVTLIGKLNSKVS